MTFDKTYALIRQYTMSLLRYPPMKEQIRRYGDMTAEEIINEVATDVYKHWDETWDDGLVRFVTSRRLIDLYRKRQTRTCVQLDIAEWNEPLYELSGLDDLIDMSVRWKRLSKKDQKLIELVVQGYGHRQIANMMDTTISNSRDRLYRVRLMLKGLKPISTTKRR